MRFKHFLSKQIITELKVGKGKRSLKLPEYWVFFKDDTAYFIPKLSNNMSSDAAAFFGGHKQWVKIQYGTPSNFAQHKQGWMLVDTVKKEINLDITSYTKHQSRRKDERAFSRKSHEDDYRRKEFAYPIFQGEVGFDRIVDLEKALKLLTKLKPEVAEYVVVGDDRVHNRTVNGIIGAKDIPGDHRKTFDVRNQTIEMYHGTSKSRYDDIKREGLRPSMRAAYSDMLPHYSERNVYLSFSPAEAANYATREAIEDKSNPVILKVSLNQMQFSKLLPDEDSMNWLTASVGEKYVKQFMARNQLLQDIWVTPGIWSEKDPQIHIKNLDHENKRFGLSWLLNDDSYLSSGLPDHIKQFRKHARDVLTKYGLTTPEKILQMEQALYFDIISTFIQGTNLKSIKQNGCAAYPGTIKPSAISVDKTWSLKGSKIAMDGGSEEYEKALGVQAMSVRRGEKPT